jgi:peptide deformylase
MQLSEMDARIFLHEFDHLYGINFIDRVSKVKLDMALKKQQKLIN